MKKFAQWGSFIRRMSVFYIFFAIIVVLFLVYYYYYIPSNQTEFSDRANRELKRLTDNFSKKSDELESTFKGIQITEAFENKEEPYKKLNENAPYEIDTALHHYFEEPAI